jgi:hypothetical protein
MRGPHGLCRTIQARPKETRLYVQYWYSILAIAHIRSNFWAQTIGTGTNTAAELQASPLPMNQSEDAHRNISWSLPRDSLLSPNLIFSRSISLESWNPAAEP